MVVLDGEHRRKALEELLKDIAADEGRGEDE